MLRFTTAGESHGQALVSILEGVPAGLPLLADHVNDELARRQQGYGRGRRMQIERDTAEFLSGVRAGETIGSPIAMLIRNRDWANWQEIMDPAPRESDAAGTLRRRAVTRVRPGHADLTGILKYDRDDARDILERASARETTARVAAGAVARRLLAELGVTVGSHLVHLGGVDAVRPARMPGLPGLPGLPGSGSLNEAGMNTPEPGSLSPEPGSLSPEPGSLNRSSNPLNQAADASPLRTLDPVAEAEMIARIDAAKRAGNTLGGVCEVVVEGLPVGLGSHVSWDRKLDGRLAAAMMSIPAVKGVEIGMGFAAARAMGSDVHDEIAAAPGRTRAGNVRRATNRAGGLEGGMTTGEPLVVRVAMKPISTLMRPLGTVDVATGDAATAVAERSDVTAVPAMGVIAESMAALVMASAMLEKFGGDSLGEVQRNLDAYLSHLAARLGG